MKAIPIRTSVLACVFSSAMLGCPPDDGNTSEVSTAGDTLEDDTYGAQDTYDPSTWGEEPEDTTWGEEPEDTTWGEEPEDTTWGEEPEDTTDGEGSSTGSDEGDCGIPFEIDDPAQEMNCGEELLCIRACSNGCEGCGDPTKCRQDLCKAHADPGSDQLANDFVQCMAGQCSQECFGAEPDHPNCGACVAEKCAAEDVTCQDDDADKAPALLMNCGESVTCIHSCPCDLETECCDCHGICAGFTDDDSLELVKFFIGCFSSACGPECYDGDPMACDACVAEECLEEQQACQADL